MEHSTSMDISVPDTTSASKTTTVGSSSSSSDVLLQSASSGKSSNAQNIANSLGEEHNNNMKMDISLTADNADMNINENNLQSSPPLKSVEEEERTTEGELHEHHHSLTASNQFTDDTIDDNNDDEKGDNDMDMSNSYSFSSPTKNNDYEPQISPCRSIEEASVNTTIEEMDQDDDYDDEDTSPSSKEGMIVTTAASSSSSSDHIVEEAAASEEMTTTTTTTESPSNNNATAAAAAHNVKLRLTPEETRLFDLLTNAAIAYESGQLIIDPNPTSNSVSARGGFTKQESNNPPGEESWLKPPPTVDRIEIRIAGGWVRDKIINQHSVDVDVALDCMMGVQFARIVQCYLAKENMEKEEEEREKKAEQKMKGVEGEGIHQEGVNEDCDINQKEEEQQVVDVAEQKLLPQSKQGGNNSSKAAKQAKKKKQKNKQPKIGVIGANPSQSKHLETATMNIHGIDIDFVNLRAEEVYELNSRIPTSQTRMFGTPLEDALRRDFTINSLFYNIRTKKIEDWTGRGLDDLFVHRRIVTPVDAHTTFHDDPLRILRAVRFCVRLDFTLDDEIKQAAMSKRVHHSLHVKVSRERVGKELEGMLTGKHARPGRALDMIADLHLAGSVFAFPGSFPGDHDYAGGPVTGHILGVNYNCSLGMDTVESIERASEQRAMGWEESKKLLSVLPTVMEGHVDEREVIIREKTENRKDDIVAVEEEPDLDAASLGLPTEVDTRLLYLCVFILPFHNLTFPDKKGRTMSVTSEMLKEALKFSVRDVQAVTKILSHVDEMTTILSEIRSQLAEAQDGRGGGGEDGEEEDTSPFQLTLPCRLRTGLLLRSLKEHWTTCLLTAAAWEIRSYQRLEDGSSPQAIAAASIPADQPSREFYRAIVDGLELDECWKVRPHLNGKEIIKELSLPKGPLVGVYLEDQTRWMLLNPEGTKEECTTHLQERKREREQEELVEGGEKTVDDQNEVVLGVANGEGHSSPITEGENGSKHFSKKIRAETTD